MTQSEGRRGPSSASRQLLGKAHSTHGPHKSLATRQLHEGVKAAIADQLPQGRGICKNKDARLKQRYAKQFFRNGYVNYTDPQDPVGTSVKITKLKDRVIKDGARVAHTTHGHPTESAL